MRLSLLVILFVLVQFTSSALDAPKPKDKPLTKEERPMHWLLAIERLRSLPRPGDLQNAGIQANIGDVIATTPEQKAAIVDALNAYDAAMLKKADQWENEMKAVRAEHEAKIVAALPEARREAAKKALDFSHANWLVPMEFEAKLKSDFLQKKLAAEAKGLSAEEQDGLKKEFLSFIKNQRHKAEEQNAATIKALKAMFNADELDRLNAFDKNREVPVPEKKK